MAIANYFYNETTRKYVAVFGTVFNQIKIERTKSDGTFVQDLIVPLSYGPQQKFLARLQQDPNLNRQTALNLPRMSFEILSMAYDPERKVGQTRKMLQSTAEVDGQRNFTYVGAPYNLDFQLSIMTKYTEDAAKVLEQIIPFFQPDYTQTVKLIDDADPIDIPIILNSVSTDEIYEGDFMTRRGVLYTLGFTMKAWYFGPQRKQKVIKFVDTNFYNGVEADAPFLEGVDVRPGLDSNGNPVNGRDGVTATATSTVENGVVTSITVVNDGEKYDANNTVVVTIADPGVITATATGTVSNGELSSIAVNEGGGYYSSIPSVTISEPDGVLVAATASAEINANNVVSNISVDTAGTFYRSANVTISEPEAKSTVVKFGNDALAHNNYSDVVTIGSVDGNIITGTNQGYKIEFWIYPTLFPSSYALRVVSFNGSNVRIEYNSTTGELIYYPPFGGGQTSRNENLVLNQWNHVRFEHVGTAQRWIVNGVNAGGGFVGQGTIITNGTDVVIGDYVDSSNNAANGDRSFIGYMDNFSIDSITALSVGDVTVPNTAISGTFITENFEKVNAVAVANVVNGEVVSIDITNPGENYLTEPTVTITGPNAPRTDFQATAIASLSNGTVDSITVTDGGKFYSSSNVQISAPYSVQATANVQISAHGDVYSITITNQGAGYRSAPAVTIGAPAAVSIPYTQIEFDDNWGVITTIVEEE